MAAGLEEGNDDVYDEQDAESEAEYEAEEEEEQALEVLSCESTDNFVQELANCEEDVTAVAEEEHANEEEEDDDDPDLAEVGDPWGPR